jgi:Asp-tRNA(Asn)/Glu-tRNA(Gln) amidotransferase C subunit
MNIDDKNIKKQYDSLCIGYNQKDIDETITHLQRISSKIERIVDFEIDSSIEPLEFVIKSESSLRIDTHTENSPEAISQSKNKKGEYIVIK